MGKIYVVVSISKGCVDEIVASTTRTPAIAAKKRLMKTLRLTDEDKPDNRHYRECRWNDENEVHLHRVDLL